MPPPLRSTSRSVLHWFLVAWFCLTLPVAALFLVNRYLRFEFFETINHYVAKVGGLDYVFIGDSITVGGHNFGWSLFGNPFLSRNLGCNGYTVRQVLDLVPQALECHPRWVFILAGTNDFLNDEYDQEKMLQEYRLMLAGIKNATPGPSSRWSPRPPPVSTPRKSTRSTTICASFVSNNQCR